MVQLQTTRQTAGPVLHANDAIRRACALLIACGASLFAAGCAHYVADTPALQWQLNTADADSGRDAATASTDVAPSPCGQAGQSSWSDRCYVHREGPDPMTGVAYTQL